MNRWEFFHELANDIAGKEVSWLATAIPLLAMDIHNATGKDVQVSGPYGLRAAVCIAIKEGFGKILTVTADFEDDGGIKLYYDTGETVKRFGKNTLGDMSGFNNISEPLPNDIDKIIGLFREAEEWKQ